MLSSFPTDSAAAAAAAEPAIADPALVDNEDDSAPHDHLLLSVGTPEAAADSETMQRMGGVPSGMRNYSPSPAHSNGGLLWTKSGALDRHKLGLVILIALLGLWVIYDTCAHLHQESFAEAVQRAQDDMSREGAGGSAHAVGSVLRAPGSADGGKLPESLMFRNLDYHSTSFFNDAGVLTNPIQPAHLVSKEINGLHVATIVPGQTRGNHMHMKHSEVLVLVHGKFMLRVAMLGNDGTWISEDHLFEIGLPSDPFSPVNSVVSSTPIGIELPAKVCHALRNVDSQAVAFFTSYYVLGMDEKREEPNRDICRAQPLAFLK